VFIQFQNLSRALFYFYFSFSRSLAMKIRFENNKNCFISQYHF
jgi:hypothetical protein